MEQQKTYRLNSALLFVFLFSVAMVAATRLVTPLLSRFQATLLPDAGASWYYWKLPHSELWATLSMWVLYLGHQISVWWLIVKLKSQPRLPLGRIGRNPDLVLAGLENGL